MTERIMGETDRPFVFMMIKPLGLEAKVQDKLMSGISALGQVEAQKRVRVSRELIEKHYDSIKTDKEGNLNRHFYPITTYLTGKDVEALIVEDTTGSTPNSFITKVRSIIGPSNPIKSFPYQLRYLALKYAVPFKRVLVLPVELRENSNGYCLDNLIHCSDSLDASIREVSLWFSELTDKYKGIYERIKTT